MYRIGRLYNHVLDENKHQLVVAFYAFDIHTHTWWRRGFGTVARGLRIMESNCHQLLPYA